MTIGFVILSHRGGAQLLRLVTTLNRLYDDPPIVCHHDFGQAALDVGAFPANVRFVVPHHRTSWGKWVVVEAVLAALAMLYADGGSDWFMLLSAADYPIRSGNEVMAELADSSHDAFLDTRSFGGAAGNATLSGTRSPKLSHFDDPTNVRLKWSHYLGTEIWIPIVRSDPRWRLGRYTLRLPFTASGPFDDDFACFYGDHWFTANRKAARVLLNPTPRHLELQRHLRMRTCVDECYYQTVLCNTPGLSVCIENRRYAEWNGGGAHPMNLTEAQLPKAFASGAFFARKFTSCSAALDAIDQRLSLR